MTVANPVKGEVEVKTSAASFVLCFPWEVQKAVTAKFEGKQFLATFGKVLADLSDDDLEYLFGSGLRAKHPALTDAQVAGVLSEVGAGAAVNLLGESVRLAYDLPPAQEEAEGSDPSPPAAPAPTDGTPTPASTSGSSSD